MSRTHDITISAFDLDRLESQLDGAISELSDAKVTAEFWIGQAEKAEEAAADLKAELADTRREWKAELEEQARLLGMSGERECDLRGKLDRERALADLLADALLITLSAWITSPDAEQVAASLAAWKEARSE